MALYLCHMPVYQWLVVLFKGSIDWTHGGKIGSSWEDFRAFHRACGRFKKLYGVADPDCAAWREAHNLGAWSVPVATKRHCPNLCLPSENVFLGCRSTF